MPEKSILQEKMRGDTLSLIRQVIELGSLAEQRLAENGSSDEVVAALRMVEELGRSSRLILAAHGGVIFPNGSNSEAAPVVIPVDERVNDAKPVTFAGLLRQKVEKLFAPEVQTVSRRLIMETIRDSISPEAFAVAGVDGRGKEDLSREVAVTLAYTNLTTPGSKFNREGLFAKGSVAHIFLFPQGLKTKILYDWSEEIGYDWNKNPRVTLEEALGIRGLARLESRSVRL